MALPSFVTSTALLATNKTSKQNAKENNFAVAIVTWEELKQFESNFNKLLFSTNIYREIFHSVYYIHQQNIFCFIIFLNNLSHYYFNIILK